MAPVDSSTKIASSVSKLSLNPPKAKGRKDTKARAPKKSKPVADSWEDEETTSGSDTESGLPAHETNDDDEAEEGAGTQAPPPTPISPNYSTAPSPAVTSPSSPPGFDQDPAIDFGPATRPEKTDAVARRMIAGALGVRAPKPTEEQRAYDRAVREKERKRREEDQEKEQKRLAEAEKAKKSVWED